jgi:hypothetical protein
MVAVLLKDNVDLIGEEGDQPIIYYGGVLGYGNFTQPDDTVELAYGPDPYNRIPEGWPYAKFGIDLGLCEAPLFVNTGEEEEYKTKQGLRAPYDIRIKDFKPAIELS